MVPSSDFREPLTRDRPSLWRVWGEVALSWVYPEVCAICGAASAKPSEGYVCVGCRERPGQVRWVTAPYCERCGIPVEGEVTGAFTCGNCASLSLAFDAARAAVVATPFVLDLVHRYKYRGARWLEPLLAGWLVEAAGKALRVADWDGLVPVPLHRGREREREFNQAQRLADRLSEATGIPVVGGGVERRVATRTQALLDRGERSKNMRGAFALRPGVRVGRGTRWVVVDDVLTTGATTSAVAAVLRQAGAGRVEVWTVARGL